MSEQDHEWLQLAELWQSEQVEGDDLETVVQRHSVQLWLYIIAGSILALIGVGIGLGLLLYSEPVRHQVVGFVIVAVVATAWPWELWVRRGTVRAHCETSVQMIALQIQRCQVNIKAFKAARIAFFIAALFFLITPLASVFLQEPRLAMSSFSSMAALLIYVISIAASTWFLAAQRRKLVKYQDILATLKSGGENG